MQVGYFTERPYRWLPEEEILKNRAFFAISNRFFDREKAADDYNYYIDEYCYAEDLGFDALARVRGRRPERSDGRTGHPGRFV